MMAEFPKMLTSNFSIPLSTSVESGLESGLEFVLSHLSNPKFPRTISTFRTHDGQFLVESTDKALIAFSDSKYQDCRINGFPLLKKGKSWIPDLLFIDIDAQKSIDSVLINTLGNITRYLGPHAKPTVIMSGNGYHILQPVECLFTDYLIRQKFHDFSQFCVNGNPAEEFLRFAKIYLSGGRADRKNNPSFRSCMLRIPNTINSKNGKPVLIIREWNGYRPQLTKELFILFEEYLIQKKIDEDLLQQKIFKYRLKNKKKQSNLRYNNTCSYPNNYYDWIDRLLESGVEDHRKVITDLILAPYLTNIKKLPFDESFSIIRKWLDKCDKVRRLDNPRNLSYRIKRSLKIAETKQIGPMSWERIKIDSSYNNLYFLLVNKTIITINRKNELGEK